MFTITFWHFLMNLKYSEHSVNIMYCLFLFSDLDSRLIVFNINPSHIFQKFCLCFLPHFSISQSVLLSWRETIILIMWQLSWFYQRTIFVIAQYLSSSRWSLAPSESETFLRFMNTSCTMFFSFCCWDFYSFDSSSLVSFLVFPISSSLKFQSISLVSVCVLYSLEDKLTHSFLFPKQREFSFRIDKFLLIDFC
jgi:hypothetical protein